MYRFLASLLKNIVKRPFYEVYQHRLKSESKRWRFPNHIGIILDGNRRYARDLGLDNVLRGHAVGADKLTEVLRWCYDLKIPVVSIWIFSLDNFSRDKIEVDGILKLIEEKTKEFLVSDDVHKNQVKVRYIGKLELLPESLLKAIREMEKATESYTRHRLNIAIAYGGREEITDACQHFLVDQMKSGLSVDEIVKKLDPENLDPYLYTSGIPDPDLIIRTSGEVRLSGFLLWQSAYSEFYFCDTFWPQFRKIDLLRAIRSYDIRQRRFGR